MQKIRKQFPLINNLKQDNNPIVYFDNGATTQKPQSVIDAMVHFYTYDNSNVHRSHNPLAERATVSYENARKKIAQYINAPKKHEIIFTRGVTEGVNLVAKTWGIQNVKKGDVIVLTELEHHSNIVPWIQLAQQAGAVLEYLPMCKKEKRIRLNTNVKNILKKKGVTFLAMQYASNTLGCINEVKEIIEFTKQNHPDAKVLIDGAQIMGHKKVDVQDLGCDFFTISGHKMFGPTGIGVLWAPRTILESMPEWHGGGDMIKDVHKTEFSVNDIPHKFEAGTPNIAGAIGLGAAVDFLSEHVENFYDYEIELKDYLFDSLSKLDFVTLISKNSDNQLPVAAITTKDIHPHDLAEFIGQYGIYIRAGKHCTQVLHDSIGEGATARISLALYNTKDEIDYLIEKLIDLNNRFQNA